MPTYLTRNNHADTPDIRTLSPHNGAFTWRIDAPSLESGVSAPTLISANGVSILNFHQNCLNAGSATQKVDPCICICNCATCSYTIYNPLFPCLRRAKYPMNHHDQPRMKNVGVKSQYIEPPQRARTQHRQSNRYNQ